ncbi:MAG: hypothetical protein ACYCVY_02675 [Acidiferrobacteraceae bacterium]
MLRVAEEPHKLEHYPTGFESERAAGERYEFIARTVRRFGDGRLKRGEKAVVLRFLERVSGYSRQQRTRLVKRGCERPRLAKRYRGSRTRFARTCTDADVLVLAPTDTLHGTLSRLATKKLMERAYGLFGDARYCQHRLHLSPFRRVKMSPVGRS